MPESLRTYSSPKARAGLIRRQKRRRRRVEEYVRQVKANTPCADCGKYFPWWCMDFDHVRGVKEFELSNTMHSMARARREIAKCDIVCCMDHRNREHQRGQ